MTGPQHRALDEVRAALTTAATREAKAAAAAEAIRRTGYRWVGIYDVTDAEIAAIAWSGSDAPAYPRFPVTQGLCGAAVASGAPVVVGDVTKDPRYLMTFGSTRSEMIVPVARLGRVIGLIDVESEEVNAFGEEDCAFVEACAEAMTDL